MGYGKNKQMRAEEQMLALERSQHECDPDDSWGECDARGIYLCRVCSECVEWKLAQYRPEILTGYDQSDVNEPIEPEG